MPKEFERMELFLHVGMFTSYYGRHWRIGLGDRLVKLYLQFGYGMMEHCRQLVTEWGGGTVILSPRDLTREQLSRVSAAVRDSAGGRILLDPQFYLPRADHERLCSHDYWPESYSTGTFWQGPALTELLSKLAQLNRSICATAFILPGVLAATINSDWLEIHRSILEEANALDSGLPLYLTVALSGDATRNEQQIADLLERSEQWNAAGYYIVCEHPGGNYLVDDPIWLANVVDLAAGLRLRGARVVLGYCNHQMLIAACAKADAICSGTWMNVRSFPPDKFRTSYEDEIKQRATWYYCPQALSEYRIPFLDIAYRLRILGRLAPPARLNSQYAADLFSGSQPSIVGFTEQAAFRHYLHCLRTQCAEASLPTYDETVEGYEEVLGEAETLLSRLTAAGIRGQFRDFSQIIDVNRAALSVLGATRGPMLRRRWSTM